MDIRTGDTWSGAEWGEGHESSASWVAVPQTLRPHGASSLRRMGRVPLLDSATDGAEEEETREG